MPAACAAFNATETHTKPSVGVITARLRALRDSYVLLLAISGSVLKAESSTMRVNLGVILWVLVMTFVSAAYLLLRPVPHLYDLGLTTTASVPRTGSPLEHILVGISFHFNRQKLAYLKYVSML